MLPILTLVILMASAAILGAQRWEKKSTKYILIAAIGFVQTILILIDMFTMKMPSGKFLP